MFKWRLELGRISHEVLVAPTQDDVALDIVLGKRCTTDHEVRSVTPGAGHGPSNLD